MAQVAIETLIGSVAQRCMGAPLPTLVEAYLSAARDLCRRSGFFTEELPVTTVADDAQYPLTPTDDDENEIIGVRVVSIIISSTTDIRDLMRMARRRWCMTEPSRPPEYFDYIGEAEVAFHPTPDAAYAATVTAILQPKLGSTTIDSDLVLRWDTGFMHGALASLQRIPGQPYRNLGQAEIDDAVFERWVNKASSAAAKKFQRGVTPY